MSNGPQPPPPPQITATLRHLAVEYGLPEEFLIELLFEKNDWSFVVKAHALLESAVCALIATHLHKPSLEDVLAERVEMSSRIEIIKALGLADEAERKMMRALGALRNKLVHNAKQTNFTFVAHFSNADLRRNFGETFSFRWPEVIPGTGSSRQDFAIQQPKLAVWTCVLGILTRTMSERLQHALEAARQRAFEEYADEALRLEEPAQPRPAGAAPHDPTSSNGS